MAKNYYQILGISQSAGPEEIRKAYRRLVLRYHPDRNGGGHQYELVVKEIYQAYSVLSVPAERKKYDEYLRHEPGPFNSVNSDPKSEPESNSGPFTWNFSKAHYMIIWLAIMLFTKAYNSDERNNWTYPTHIPSNTFTVNQVDSMSVGDRLFGNPDSTLRTSSQMIRKQQKADS